MDSILNSIKQMHGIDENINNFDSEITVNINSVFMSLKQLGVGPSTTFLITDSEQKWSDFVGESTDLEAVKMYMYLKVRLGFDPPSSAYVLTSMENQIKELEFRLNVECDVPEVVEEVTV